ncbi:MAG: hypothetical protein IT365_07445 [Candidatus Hydrogenedentes bacterium]|nr:hypothetical protein [Candidatus Hydrogenedentota bacterium]
MRSSHAVLLYIVVSVVLSLPLLAEISRNVGPKDAPQNQLKAVELSHPRLFELKRDTDDELESIVMRDYVVPDEARRRELADWHRKPRKQEDSILIAATLTNAYAQDPPDWPVLCVALSAAYKGVSDPRILEIARELLTTAAELPDEAMIAVGAALEILALTGKSEDIELLKKSASRAFLGVKVDAGFQGFVGGHREFLCQVALQALFLYAPLDQAIVALKSVRDSLHPDSVGFDGFIRSLAESYLNQLERIRKGEKVSLPILDPVPLD